VEPAGKYIATLNGKELPRAKDPMPRKTCSECRDYNKETAIVRNYPNSDNELLSWRTCANECTVRGQSTYSCFVKKEPELEGPDD